MFQDDEEKQDDEAMETANGDEKLEGEEEGDDDVNEDGSAAPPKKKLKSDVTEDSQKSKAALIDETAEPITDDGQFLNFLYQVSSGLRQFFVVY